MAPISRNQTSMQFNDCCSPERPIQECLSGGCLTVPATTSAAGNARRRNYGRPHRCPGPDRCQGRRERRGKDHDAVAWMVAGADFIEDMDLLRHGGMVWGLNIGLWADRQVFGCQLGHVAI
jgi:hypothetical protein